VPWLAAVLLASCLPITEFEKNAVLFVSPYLTAILKLPAGYDSTRTYPLVVALHGNGGTAGVFAPSFGAVAEAGYFVAVPEAQYARPDGGYSWYYLTSDRTLHEVYDSLPVRAVVGLVQAIRGSYRIGDVYLLGFSQGASLAYMTGFLHPAQFRGILAISGWLPAIDTVGAIVHAADVDSAAGLRVFVARGRDDTVILREEFLAQTDLLVAHGYPFSSYEFDGGHVLTNEVMTRALQFLRGGTQR
jgi:phospholipase/carboxylesterase